jgi:hypothetical protein
VIDYRLKADATRPLTLEVFNDKGELIRRFASTDKPEPVNPQALQIDPRWIRPARILASTAGTHRFVWDLHYPPPDGPRSYPISAIWGATPSGPLGPAVLPGRYTVRLTVGEKSIEQPLVVVMDPRVARISNGLEEQFKLSMVCYNGMASARDTIARLRHVRMQLDDRKAKAAELAATIDAIEAKLVTLEGAALGGKRGRNPQPQTASLNRVSGELGRLLAILQGADAMPTKQATAAVAQSKVELDALLARWKEIREKDLNALNIKLKAANLPAIDPAGK